MSFGADDRTEEPRKARRVLEFVRGRAQDMHMRLERGMNRPPPPCHLDQESEAYCVENPGFVEWDFPGNVENGWARTVMRMWGVAHGLGGDHRWPGWVRSRSEESLVIFKLLAISFLKVS